MQDGPRNKQHLGVIYFFIFVAISKENKFTIDFFQILRRRVDRNKFINLKFVFAKRNNNSN